MDEVPVRHLGYLGGRDTVPRVVGIREKIEVHSQVAMGIKQGRGEGRYDTHHLDSGLG